MSLRPIALIALWILLAGPILDRPTPPNAASAQKVTAGKPRPRITPIRGKRAGIRKF